MAIGSYLKVDFIEIIKNIMKHLLVYAHPNKESFSHAILERCLETLSRLGAQVEVRDLYAMGFNPVYGLDDMGPVNKDHLPNDVILEQSYIKECDKITIISPIWWGYLPAILKGYFDRVFTEGFAYHQVDNQTIGLLSDKKIGMINTFYSKDVYPSGENIALIFNAIIEKSIFD